ncbi:MAG: anaerobic sulfatase maturase [Tepidisphaerales bacterium]
MTDVSPPGFHIMTKPIGPICNLDCKYCFYLEKEKLYPGKSSWRMSDEVLEAYIRQYIEAQRIPEINFAWQGGEPTLLGVGFFRKVVELQAKYANGKRIHNAFQTNGTLLDDEWGEFLAANKFLIGLSIDGPREIHDCYRVDKKGQPTFDQVMRGRGFLAKHGVEFNALCVVNRANSQHPLETYNFLKSEVSEFMQFIPLVERSGDTSAASALTGGIPRPTSTPNPPVRAPAALTSPQFDLAEPPVLQKTEHGVSLPIIGVGGRDRSPSGPSPVHDGGFGEATPPSNSPVTPWSVQPQAYGEFLCRIFDHWVRHDVGRVFVQLFDVQLGIWMGMPSSLCVFAETCGDAMAVEHNGDLYSCDHYVYPRYHLGNVLQGNLREMVDSPAQRKFGRDKRDLLPKFCQECDVRFACNGECPKHRFMRAPDGEFGLNYLCPAYKKFFHHVDPFMTRMGQLLQNGHPAAAIMPEIAAGESEGRQKRGWETAGRNDPCPCGSGKKFKKCCWDKTHAGS